MKNKFVNFKSKNIIYNPNLRIRLTHNVAIAVLILNALVFTEAIVSISIQLLLAFIVFVHNIDDRILGKTLSNNSKKLKKQTVELKKSLKEANAATEAKSIFLANMSHEIRTPLNGIIGFLNILESTPLNKEQKEYLKVIDNSSHILLHVINDILDFSKIEANKLDLESISIDIYDDIVPSFDMFKIKASEKNIVFEVNVDKNIPNIMGDLLRIKQILINLINNAIKFTKIGTVSVDIKLLEQSEENVKLKISVQDTGIGIAKDKQHLVFEDFKQSDTSISREFDGTGLGLSITKKLLALFGSHLELRSELGEGCEFYFTLDVPISKEIKVMEKENVVDKNFSHLNILVAEDNVVNQMLLKYLLDEKNINYVFTENGVEVVEEYKKNPNYDIVLMDINMPKLDGIGATLQIKKYETDNNMDMIPIVALTASTLSQDVVRFKATGMDDYLSKPIDKVKLFNTLATYTNIKLPIVEEIDLQYNKEEICSSMEIPVEFLDELVNMFFEKVDSQLKSLEDAIEKNELKEIESLAHDIKGSAANIRLEAIREIAEVLEKNSKSNETNYDYKSQFVLLRETISQYKGNI